MPTHNLSVGFKSTLAAVGVIIACLTAYTPYASLKQRLDGVDNAAKALQVKTELDHDILIRLSTDVQYIKDFVVDQQRKLPQNGATR